MKSESILICGLTHRQIESLIMSLPRDRDGVPINPSEQYITHKEGVPCNARMIVDFGVSTLDGDRWRTCTTADVVVRHKER